jgi:hypothetical protein
MMIKNVLERLKEKHLGRALSAIAKLRSYLYPNFYFSELKVVKRGILLR